MSFRQLLERPRRGRVGRVAVLAAVLLGLAVVACAARRAPPIQLVETVPVETRLGNPELPAAHEVWLDMIRRARRSIEFEQFYLSRWPGGRLDPILDAVGHAARRGVRVRIVLDARMHDTYPQPADSLGGVPGMEVRVVDMRRLAGGVQHAKFILVDGEEVFVGSQNLDWRALEHIHELGVRVRDRRVAVAFAGVFEMDWAHGRAPGAAAGADTALVPAAAPRTASVEPRAIPIVLAARDTAFVWTSFSPLRLLPDSVAWDLDVLVRLLDGARHEAVVQLLSYGVGGEGRRDSTLDAALRRAAARGVRLRLLVSDWEAGGGGMADLQSLSQVPNVEARLSRVAEWSGGYIPFARVEHCKYLVVDSLWTWVGTSNWEPGYWNASRNAALTLRNRPLALQARRVFETSWREPGALPVRAGVTYSPRVHGEEPPPGRRVVAR